jgi:hypothetical protein
LPGYPTAADGSQKSGFEQKLPNYILRRAPIALADADFLVRCVTDINMMFITPTPPKSRPRPEIAMVPVRTSIVIQSSC